MISPLENWGITAIVTTSSRPRLLKTFLKSRLKWRTASRRTWNRKLFLHNTRTHWRSPLLALPGTWRRPTTTRETKLLMLRHILHIPYLNDIRDAESRSGRTLTESWWSNGFGTQPTLPCILHRLPLWHNFLAARLQIGH